MGQETGGDSTLIFKLTEPARQEILRRFRPRFSEVVADHITHQSGVHADAPLPSTPQATRVVGYVSDQALEALVAEVDGTTTRPDSGTYHITLSLEPEQREAKDSNTLLQSGWQSCEPFFIGVVPARTPS